jgi:hypothetical protein
MVMTLRFGNARGSLSYYNQQASKAASVGGLFHSEARVVILIGLTAGCDCRGSFGGTDTRTL